MKIICVGRNYSEHAKELGNEVPDEPVLFMKADSSLMRQRDAFFIPDWTNEVHYELELVVRITRLGKRIQQKFAPKYYKEVTVGLDFTARDVQAELKAKGLPWEKAKSFDQSAVVGDWVATDKLSLEESVIELKRNGKTVQYGKIADMIYSVDELISYSSTFFTLKIGDLLFTGTPKGVGKMVTGDTLEGYLNGQKLLQVTIR